MSITKIIVVNALNGAPSVSTVVVPGQSQISRGIIVLRTIEVTEKIEMPF